jgi:hypothetical protein
LLCDNCNWEFTGFAVPGTVSSRSNRRYKRPNPVGVEKDENLNNRESDLSKETLPKKRAKARKKAKIKLK